MTNRLRIALTVSTTILGALALSAGELPREWEHWSHFRAIEIPAAEATPGPDLVRVALPESLFEQARSDLADLRVVDASGDDVGYVVFDRGQGPETSWRETELADTGFVRGEFTQVVADTGDDDALHNRVQVTLPPSEKELFTWVEVAASQDGDTWRVMQAKAPLYRFRGRGFGRAVSISYPRTRDRWLRLRLLEGAKPIEVERLRVAERVEEEDELVDLRRSLVPNAESDEGESWWEPQGRIAEVPIAAVRIETETAAFHRPIKVSVSEDGDDWRQVGEGNVYRYPADDPSLTAAEPDVARQSLRVEVRDVAAPLWRVAILDRDDPPIEDLAVSLMQNRRYVVFRAAPDDAYRLVYGNPGAETPEYEIAALTSRDALAGARLAELGAEQTNDAWRSSEPFTERHPVLLWIVLGLAVAVIGGMALKALRN